MGRVLADVAPPCPRGTSGLLFDEILESLQVRLDLMTYQTERFAGLFDDSLRISLELQHNPRLAVGRAVECHDAAVIQALTLFQGTR
jgi:hypothetical protein